MTVLRREGVLLLMIVEVGREAFQRLRDDR